jgi:hypothetical protein
MNKRDQALDELCREITELTAVNPHNARELFFKLPVERQQIVANRLPPQIRQQLFAGKDKGKQRGWGFPADPVM